MAEFVPFQISSTVPVDLEAPNLYAYGFNDSIILIVEPTVVGDDTMLQARIDGGDWQTLSVTSTGQANAWMFLDVTQDQTYSIEARLTKLFFNGGVTTKSVTATTQSGIGDMITNIQLLNDAVNLQDYVFTNGKTVAQQLANYTSTPPAPSEKQLTLMSSKRQNDMWTVDSNYYTPGDAVFLDDYKNVMFVRQDPNTGTRLVYGTFSTKFDLDSFSYLSNLYNSNIRSARSATFLDTPDSGGSNIYVSDKYSDKFGKFDYNGLVLGSPIIESDGTSAIIARDSTTLYWTDNGNKLIYISESSLRSYDASTPYNISTTSISSNYGQASIPLNAAGTFYASTITQDKTRLYLATRNYTFVEIEFDDPNNPVAGGSINKIIPFDKSFMGDPTNDLIGFNTLDGSHFIVIDDNSYVGVFKYE